jgi:hypothetical protein
MTNRKAAQDWFFNLLKSVDDTDVNVKFYEKKFGNMDDKMFDKYMKDLQDGKTKLYFYTPPKVVNINTAKVIAAAEKIGLKLFERLLLWDHVTKRYILTPQEYLVVDLPVRPQKQYLDDKISLPEGDTKISTTSGQVMKPDKGSSIAIVELQTILSKGLKSSAYELMRVRGGDIYAYANLKSQLEETGSATLDSIPDDSRARSNEILKAYFTGMHLGTNL